MLLQNFGFQFRNPTLKFILSKDKNRLRIYALLWHDKRRLITKIFLNKPIFNQIIEELKNLACSCSATIGAASFLKHIQFKVIRMKKLF